MVRPEDKLVVCTFEQRNSQRSDVDWPVSVWHPKAMRFFNGHSVNVSRTGAFVVLPMKTPVREGQQLEVNFPRSEHLAEAKGGYARIKNARVVRVDRSATITSAQVRVGLQFFEQPEPALIPE